MTAHSSPPLADQLASLRTITAASPAGGWLPEVLHALILACLTRLFSRLEQIIQLWQAGELSPPQTRALPNRPSHQDSTHAPVPNPARRTAHLARTGKPRPATATPLATRVVSAPCQTATRPPSRAAHQSPSGAAARSIRPRPAHDPPVSKPSRKPHHDSNHPCPNHYVITT